MARKKKERFFVYLPCKPYVKQYLVHNFGCPDEDWPDAVSLKDDNYLHQQFKSRLKKKSYCRDSMYGSLNKYQELIPIEISKDDFYRNGWSLSKTDVVSFGLILEKKIKNTMCSYLDFYRMIGIPVSDSIKRFQELYGLTEDIWPVDSMRREYNRNGNKGFNDISGKVISYFDDIVLRKLSEVKTTCDKKKLKHENAEI